MCLSYSSYRWRIWNNRWKRRSQEKMQPAATKRPQKEEMGDSQRKRGRKRNTGLFLYLTYLFAALVYKITLWLVVLYTTAGSWKTMRNTYIWKYHHHHVVPPARISLTLSRYFSLSFIASGRFSGLHPVSLQSCCMYIRAGRPAFARPYVRVHFYSPTVTLVWIKRSVGVTSHTQRAVGSRNRWRKLKFSQNSSLKIPTQPIGSRLFNRTMLVLHWSGLTLAHLVVLHWSGLTLAHLVVLHWSRFAPTQFLWLGY